MCEIAQNLLRNWRISISERKPLIPKDEMTVVMVMSKYHLAHTGFESMAVHVQDTIITTPSYHSNFNRNSEPSMIIIEIQHGHR